MSFVISGGVVTFVAKMTPRAACAAIGRDGGIGTVIGLTSASASVYVSASS